MTGRRSISIAASIVVFLALFAGHSSAAWAGCVWSDIVRDEARVAVVRSGAARTSFVDDQVLVPGCPSDRPTCRARAFLLPGDVVLTGPTQGRYTCSGFVGGPRSSTIGWFPSATLAALPEAEQSPGDWTGHWMAPEQDITITSGSGGVLSVKGEATWGDSPERRRTGGVHTGEVSGTARPDGGVLAFAMGEDGTLLYGAGDDVTCRIRLIRRGPYLVVRDNNACGGVNVSFSGFYRRGK